MDPQQRLLLECTAEAMAAAPLLEGVQDNFSTSAVNESMGTYIGAASSDYGSVVKKHTHVSVVLDGATEKCCLKKLAEIMGHALFLVAKGPSKKQQAC